MASNKSLGEELSTSAFTNCAPYDSDGMVSSSRLERM